MLVVDDVRDIAEFIGNYLSYRGFEVAYAYDGLQAIKTARFFRPHLIVLNYQMPILCGDRTAEMLKLFPETMDAKIIFTSACAHVDEVAGRIQADAFLHTPYNLRDLDKIIHRLLPPGPPPLRYSAL